MKRYFSPEMFARMMVLGSVLLLGCEQESGSVTVDQKNTADEIKSSEKRVFLKEPPPEQERDRWEEEFLESAPNGFDPNELQRLQNQLLQESGSIQDLEEEFKKSREEYKNR